MLWGDFASFGIFYERGGCIIPAATMYSVGEKRVWDQSRGFRTEVFLPSPLLLPHPAPPASNQRAGLGVTEKKNTQRRILHLWKEGVAVQGRGG